MRSSLSPSATDSRRVASSHHPARLARASPMSDFCPVALRAIIVPTSYARKRPAYTSCPHAVARLRILPHAVAC